MSLLTAASNPTENILLTQKYRLDKPRRICERLLSRCQNVEFSAYGAAPKVAAFLSDVWAAEAPQGAIAPNFARIAKEATGNVRAALMTLQNELLLA